MSYKVTNIWEQEQNFVIETNSDYTHAMTAQTMETHAKNTQIVKMHKQ